MDLRSKVPDTKQCTTCKAVIPATAKKRAGKREWTAAWWGKCVIFAQNIQRSSLKRDMYGRELSE